MAVQVFGIHGASGGSGMYQLECAGTRSCEDSVNDWAMSYAWDNKHIVEWGTSEYLEDIKSESLRKEIEAAVGSIYGGYSVVVGFLDEEGEVSLWSVDVVEEEEEDSED